jgi:phosphoribosylanthranilate isomerase
MVRVKICGIRRAEDAAAAVEAGAGALGFNFWKGTPRYISPREAARIVPQIPGEVWAVGVFVDEAWERVREIAAETGISVLQFHGHESPEYWDELASYQRIKAFRVGKDFQPDQLARYRSAAAYLLDASVANMMGGTGQTFDWTLAERAKAFGRIILAGGLRPQNVGEAVRRVRPWGLDVSTGVESEPGKKDPRLIREFIEAVREAESAVIRGK